MTFDVPAPGRREERLAEPNRRRSLILAGGGIKVGYQAGCLQVLLDEASRRAELQARHRDDGEAVGRQPSKNREGFGSVNGLDLSGPQLNRKS